MLLLLVVVYNVPRPLCMSLPRPLVVTILIANITKCIISYNFSSWQFFCFYAFKEMTETMSVCL